MRTLSIRAFAAALKARAVNREVSPNDRYLSVYADLAQGIETMRPLDRHHAILIGHCVFGWMPTQLTVVGDSIDAAAQILCDAETRPKGVTAAKIQTLARTFQTSKGNSVVAAAKILHFIAPSLYPIWDKHVARQWGASANGKKAGDEYVKFSKALRAAIKLPDGKDACTIMREHLSRAGFDGEITDLRAAELIIFQGPR